MKRYLLIATLLTSATLFAQVDTTRIKKDIEQLASAEFEGRRTASKGDTLSREYIAKRFAETPSIQLLGDNGFQKGAGMVTETTSLYSRSQSEEYRKNKITITSLGHMPQDLKGKSVEIDSILIYKEGYEAIKTAVNQLKADSVAIISYPIPVYNVVAQIKAPKKNNKEGKAIIIGAHYDHEGIKLYEDSMRLHPGADDNASGVSVVLELARMIGEKQELLKRDVIFITFGGEERGMLGSKLYAIHPVEPLNNIELMINFDMLGRMTNKGITIRGLGTSKEGVSFMNSIPNNDKLDLIWEFRGNGPTDYSAFYLHGKIPALSFSTRLHNDYHRPMDTPDKVNYEGIKMATNYIWQIIERTVFDKKKFTYVNMY